MPAETRNSARQKVERESKNNEKDRVANMLLDDDSHSSSLPPSSSLSFTAKEQEDDKNSQTRGGARGGRGVTSKRAGKRGGGGGGRRRGGGATSKRGTKRGATKQQHSANRAQKKKKKKNKRISSYKNIEESIAGKQQDDNSTEEAKETIHQDLHQEIHKNESASPDDDDDDADGADGADADAAQNTMKHNHTEQQSKQLFKTILKSVVKIYCTYTEPHFALPWQMKRQDSSTSSGFIVQPKRIMGNAHGIAFHSVVRVRRHGCSKKFIARVLHVGHECDLCLLTVDDPEFWTDYLNPLPLGEVPQLQDAINVVGYPTGGDNVSVSQGIVSRVGVGKYSHTDQPLLAVQIDAAINAGNSGGPAVKSNKVVGVAFETLDDAENIGYIIPTPVIRHFLTDIERHNDYRGLCTLGVHWQTIENKGMKLALKLETRKKKRATKKNERGRGGHGEGGGGGVLVRKVDPLADTSRVLKPNDVLMEFDGQRIASDGTVVFREGERVDFSYLVTSKYVGDTASVTYMRDGSLKKGTVTLQTNIPLVKTHMYDQKTSYFIYGGLVFTALSYPYLEAEYGKKWDKKAPIKLCDYAFFGIPKKKDEQVVILNQVLISDVNIGYETFSNLRLYKINDRKIINMKQLVKVLTSYSGEFVRLHLEQDHFIVLDCKEAHETHSTILSQNNIPRDVSLDLEPHVAARFRKAIRDCTT